MLYMTSFDVKEGRMREFQDWVQKSEGAFKKAAPPGWTYRGTYAYVLGFGRFGAAMMWECGKYGDFDAWRAHDSPEWLRIFTDFQEFATPDPGESILLREMGDTRILEARKPKK